MAKKGPIHEIIILFKAIIDGLVFLIVGIPQRIFFKLKSGKVSKVATPVQNATKTTTEEYNPFSDNSDNRDFGQKLNDWVMEKYNNIPSVRKKREAYEASLKPIVLNPETDGVKSETKITYKYVARTEKGQIVTDYFPAFSKMDVYSYLTDLKMTVYEISTSKNVSFLHSQSSVFQVKMATKDLVFWLAQLSTYIKSGIPLTDSVRVLAQQDKRKKYKTLYSSLIFELTTGQTFSEALAR